ncbi:hypothetical protein [Spirulina sp. 06S082]|nr:hypothetical protein [Spirulina sp. 06S082]MEA5468076.1 hypothetical protein [Spirulina sp. 06S082]
MAVARIFILLHYLLFSFCQPLDLNAYEAIAIDNLKLEVIS